MLRTVLTGVCRRAASCQQLIRNAVAPANRPTPMATSSQLTGAQQQRQFSVLGRTGANALTAQPLLLSANPAVLRLATAIPSRTVTKFSLNKGKRKSVKPVLKRFMRLEWGGWIRTRTGRNKKMWRKTGNLKRRLRQHVLVNARQAWLLDKMVGPYWRKPRHYVDDPYRPYHQREEWPETRRKPIQY